MASIHLRILGYVATIFLHVTNMAVLQMNKREDLAEDVHIKAFKGMLYRFFTSWTVVLQISYAFIGLFCDLLELKNSEKKNYSVWKQLRGCRSIMFSALVWPCTMVVFIVFWSLYLYDRNLIFPEFLDKIISDTENHILHTMIVPVVVWEILFRARRQPKSHMRNIVHLTVHFLVYVGVLFYTYIKDGIWLYPIFHVTYGTVSFFYVFLSVGVITLTFYYVQWPLNYLIHGDQEKWKIG